jgi:uncharacterized protein involved in type VI secretion and phage assembly
MADRFYGVHRGVIGNTADPMKQNRVQVRLPAVPGGATQWAIVCRPFGSTAAGRTPQIGEEVLVAFENGDLQQPYVIGSLW